MEWNFLDELPRIDWDDLASAAAIAEPVLRRLAADKKLFRSLLAVVPDTPRLFNKCESDTVEDKIVFYDDADRGMRVRLRMATAQQRELAHTHRFSFSNLVLRGSYAHRNYDCEGGFSERTDPETVTPICVHEDSPGHCFTIHHTAIHATPLESAGTISLVLRGPAVKLRAPVVPRQSGRGFSRIGEGEESPERRKLRQMTRERFDGWCKQLTEFGII